MKKIKGVLITPNDNRTKPRVYDFEYNNYRDFYKLLNCDIFTIVERKFGNVYLDIYCDDEGLLKGKNKPSIWTFNSNGEVVEQIVGNVFIVSSNSEGETISLNEKQIENVLSTIIRGFSVDINGISFNLGCAVEV